MLWGLFNSCMGRIAVPGERILQIIDQPLRQPLPFSPAGAAGVFLFRGDWTVIMSETALANGVQEEQGSSRYLVICATDVGPVGLPVNDVVTLADLQAQVLQKEKGGSYPHGCSGVLQQQGHGYAAIEMERLLDDLAAAGSAE